MSKSKALIPYQFGFLSDDVAYRFDGGYVEPLARFADAKKWITKHVHEDGFVYPPATAFLDKNRRIRRNTKRPAHLHRLPPSHELQLEITPTSADRHRENASMIIHLLGYLHGTWLQFSDWWFDSRVPLKQGHNIHFIESTAEHFLSHAYKEWQTWHPTVRQRFTNILFMLNRAPSYEWDWERFVIEYMVLDACYKTGTDLKLFKKAESHSKRIDRMCAAASILTKPDSGQRNRTPT